MGYGGDPKLSRISVFPEKEQEINSPDTHSEAVHGATQRKTENWALIIILSAVAVEVARLANVDPVVRGPLVLWFCLVCTGMAWVRLLNIPDPLAEGVAAVALSVALSGLVSGATLYAGHWSPSGAMIALEVLTLVGVVLGRYLAGRHTAR
jgi:heme/copper-type cytochrome/quinol oxidase subunit 4